MSLPTARRGATRWAAALLVAACTMDGAGPAVAAPAPDGPRIGRSSTDVGTAQPPERIGGAAAATIADEPTADDVVGAPAPGAESGRVDPVDVGDSPARRLGRGLLAFPSAVYQAAIGPVRAAVWAWDRYEVPRRTRDIFFNDAGTIGLYPTARLQSGFGVNVGARFVHRDLLGHGERLGAYAGAGGRYQQIVQVQLRSGDRLGDHAELAVDAQYERRPKDVYYGVGNEDGAEARFRQRLARAASVLDLALHRAGGARLSFAVKDVDLGRSHVGPAIDEVYGPEELVGFDGVRLGYAEIELHWDTRRAASVWFPAAIHSAGLLVAGFAGRAAALDEGADFWRLGGNLQYFASLGEGPRVLVARLHTEAVAARDGDVPFTELPRLGGASYLRGYATDRYRDRVAGLASLEYEWGLSRAVTASLFVDAGQVFRSRPDLDPAAVRVGYGVAVQGYSKRSFLVRAVLASSIDGGVQLDVAFDPVFDLDPRVSRR